MAAHENAPQPDRVGPFPVEGHLGTGGMGEVYKVRDSDFDRELALKVIRAIAQGDEQAAFRFAAEGRLTGQLLHPAIPPVYHLARDEKGQWYYTMLRVRGRSLAEIIREHQTDEKSPWTLRRLLGLFVSICNGVAYAHSRGVIHRDLKPANVIVGDYGQVYVMDWGLAKVLGRDLNLSTEGGTRIYMRPKSMWEEEQERLAAAAQQETLVAPQHDPAIAETMLAPGNGAALPAAQPLKQAARNAQQEDSGESPLRAWSQDEISGSGSTPTLLGSIMGTPAYMAPEQARGEVDRLDQRADVYALGAILFEMLAGRPLRQGKTGREVLKDACAGHLPDFATITRTRRIEPELREICQRALEPELNARYGKVPDMVADVKSYLDGDRRWKLLYEMDFSMLPDSDRPPEDWIVHQGPWGIRNGALAVASYAPNAVIHLNRNVSGDVRVEIEGWVEPEKDGELSVFLAAPEIPVMKRKDDGYCVQFGAEYDRIAKLARDGFDVHQSSRYQLEQGRIYKIQAELVEGVLSLIVDGESVIARRDLFPLAGSRVGLYECGNGARIRSFRLYGAGVPKDRPAIAHPDGLAAREQWDAALEEYRRVAESHPGSRQSDEAWLKAGLCLVRLGRVAEALSLFENLKDGPAAPLGWTGLSFVEEGDASAAEREAEVLVQGLRACSDSRYEGFDDLVLHAQTRAAVLQGRCDFELSTKVFEALARHPALSGDVRSRAFYEMGRNFERPGSYPEARRCYRAALEAEGASPQVQHNSMERIMKSLSAQARKTELLSAYAEFKKLHPTWQPVLAKHLLQKTTKRNYVDIGEAESIYQECRRIARQSHLISIRNCLAVHYWDHGEIGRAIELLNENIQAGEILDRDEWNRSIHFLIWMHTGAGSIPEARKAMALHKAKITDHALAFMEARILLMEGDSMSALALSRPYLGIDWIFRFTGRLLRRLGRWDEWRTLCTEYADKEFQQTTLTNSLYNYCVSNLWLALLDHEQGELDRNRLSCVLQTSRNKVVFDDLLLGYHYMAMCMAASPGNWPLDDCGETLSPVAVLGRADDVGHLWEFQDMLDFRATFDPAWKPWASNPNPFEKA